MRFVSPLDLLCLQTDFYIVTEDESMPKREVSAGAEGELWIGGIGVAKGYLNAPDLTKEVRGISLTVVPCVCLCAWNV